MYPESSLFARFSDLSLDALVPFKCILSSCRGKCFHGNQPIVRRFLLCHRNGVIEVLEIENLPIPFPRRSHSYLKVSRGIPSIHLNLDRLSSSYRILLIILGAVSPIARLHRSAPQGRVVTRRATELELLIRSITGCVRRRLAFCLEDIDCRMGSGL